MLVIDAREDNAGVPYLLSFYNYEHIRTDIFVSQKRVKTYLKLSSRNFAYQG